MARALSSFLVLMTLLTINAGEAAAKDLWGWLEEFSGPGHFRGAFPGASLGHNFCWEDSERLRLQSINKLTAGTPDGIKPCIWTDLRFLRAGPRPGGVTGFPEVHAALFDSGLAISFKRYAMVGAGAGLVDFTSTGPGGDPGTFKDVNTYRLTLMPVRATVSPLLLAVRLWDRTPSPKLGIAKGFFKVVCVMGSLSGKNFGNPSNPYQSSTECQPSFGLQFDPYELIK